MVLFSSQLMKNSVKSLWISKKGEGNLNPPLIIYWYRVPLLLHTLHYYAALGGSSKVAAVLLTYPFQVIRARLQQRPSTNGMPRYIDSLHVIRETARFEGLRGFYKGLTANLLKNVPASSITFIVYENVLKLLKQQPPTK
ncbi:hypothetical protein F2Q68_00019139 [Brassica cretica]|uniref:Uncharacterized protein n=1 Tax=Brassica cretica TaxID=69181 RepID=A0A8S9G4C5_BRACR|nr:hypothetical protein F2Q68_00019139 [Brassica cretica]